jgi:hypothetical protein
MGSLYPGRFIALDIDIFVINYEYATESMRKYIMHLKLSISFSLGVMQTLQGNET